MAAVCDKTCDRCVYRGAWPGFANRHYCRYLEATGQRRGCPAGKGCTRKETGTKTKAKNKEREQAYLLWQQGLHNAEIARRVGVSECTVGKWRKKIWEAVNENRFD